MSSQPDSDAPADDGRPRQAPNREAVVWLLTDMVLVAGGMTALVKAQGLIYPAIQLVFIRAMVGLLFKLPLIWRERAHVLRPKHPWKSLSRVVCNAITLSSQFLASCAPIASLKPARSHRSAICRSS